MALTWTDNRGLFVGAEDGEDGGRLGDNGGWLEVLDKERRERESKRKG